MTHMIPNNATSNFIFEQTLQFDLARITMSLHTKAFMQWLLQTGKGINADIKKYSHSKDRIKTLQSSLCLSDTMLIKAAVTSTQIMFYIFLKVKHG